MRFDASYDKDTWGLALFWTAPLQGIDFLDEHAIVLLIFNFRFVVAW